MNFLLGRALIGLSLGVSSVFTTEAANAMTSCSMRDLPVEVRELVFKRLNIKEYADFLMAPDMATAGASSQFEFDLIKKSANELNQLSFGSKSDQARMKLLFSGTETLVRLRYSLSDEIQSRGLSGDQEISTFRENFLILAGLSDSKLWHGVILRALKGRNKWDQVFHRLSEDLIAEHLITMLGTMATDGDLDLLDHIIESRQLSLDKDLTDTICFGLAFNGSIDLFDQAFQRFSFSAALLPSFILYASLFRRHTLLRHLFKADLSRTIVTLKESKIQEHFHTACLHGDLSIVREFLGTHSNLSTSDNLTICMVMACGGDNLPVLKHIIWNHEEQCERQEVGLDVKGFYCMVRVATRANRKEVLEFLLLELNERPELVPYYVKLVTHALKAGAVQALEVLLGFDRHGALLMPNLRFDADNHKLLVKLAQVGRIDMIEYLLEQRDCMNGIDARWDSLDLDAAVNEMLQVACSKGNIELLCYLLRRDENNVFILPSTDPGINENECLVEACRTGRLAIVQELLRTDNEGRLIYPTVQLGAQGNRAMIEAIHHGFLEILKCLLHRERGGDGVLRYSVPGANICIQDAFLLHFAKVHNRMEIMEFFLQRDPDGILPLFPELSIHNGSLQFFVQKDRMDLLQLALEHIIPNRENEIRVAFQLAFQNRSFEAIYLLVNALHGPLPPRTTDEGLNRLCDAIVVHNYVSKKQMTSNILSYWSLPLWLRKVTKRWMAKGFPF